MQVLRCSSFLYLTTTFLLLLVATTHVRLAAGQPGKWDNHRAKTRQSYHSRRPTPRTSRPTFSPRPSLPSLLSSNPMAPTTAATVLRAHHAQPPNWLRSGTSDSSNQHPRHQTSGSVSTFTVNFTIPEAAKKSSGERPSGNDRRKKHQQWSHSLVSRPPPHRCQVPMMPYSDDPFATDRINRDYVYNARELLLEDKLVLAPIVFEGVMVSRTNTYKGLYFVSFKTLRLIKGEIPAPQAPHVRLLFQTQTPANSSLLAERLERLRGNACPPVPFNVRNNRKYLIFVKPMEGVRYAAVAEPELAGKRAKRVAKKTLCDSSNCLSRPALKPMSKRSVAGGRTTRLKCALERKVHPTPAFTWYKDGSLITSSRRIRIRTRKKRSVLLIRGLRSRDAGLYTCQADNIAGRSIAVSQLTVRTPIAVRRPAECPIQHYCLNGGTCLYYEMIAELVCRCREGFEGQRCQFKKARVNPPMGDRSSCGPYGHDIHLAEICAAWKSPPLAEMTRDEYEEWVEVERQVQDIQRKKYGPQIGPTGEP